MGELERTEPIEGRRLKLTIDYDVQKAIEDGFNASGFNGAAVVLDAQTGEVLGFSSRPAYDPNAFAAGIDRATWLRLNTDDLRPLQNRAIQGRYSPGSTFKMAVGLAALEEGVITPDFKVHCTGGANFYGRYFKCWKKGGHGTVDCGTRSSSPDVYFYTSATWWVDRIHKWATLLASGDERHRPAERGRRPRAVHRVEEAADGRKWYAGETISVSIGQGQVSVTPVSMAVYGHARQRRHARHAHLLKAYDEGKGWVSIPRRRRSRR
jgi:penicillin-binding protein 2